MLLHFTGPPVPITAGFSSHWHERIARAPANSPSTGDQTTPCALEFSGIDGGVRGTHLQPPVRVAQPERGGPVHGALPSVLRVHLRHARGTSRVSVAVRREAHNTG
eukprot:4683376-Pyramimonas_sp.AAC.1